MFKKILVMLLMALSFKIYGCAELFNAIKRNDIEKVKELILAGFDVNTKDFYWGTIPLHHAVCANANIEIVKFLLDNGAEVNAQNKYKSTPLHWAASFSNKYIVKLLLDNGATIDIKDNNGHTPLHRAILENNKAVIELLIKSKSNVNTNSSINETPLHQAVRNNDIGIIKLLIDNNTEIQACSYVNQRTHKASNFAIQTSSFVKTTQDISHDLPFEALAKEGASNFANPSFDLFVEALAKSEALAKYEATMDTSSDYRASMEWPVDLRTMQDASTLRLRSTGRYMDMVNVQSQTGLTPLHCVVSVEAAKLLLESGANKNIKNIEGQTAEDIARNQEIRDFISTYMRVTKR